MEDPQNTQNKDRTHYVEELESQDDYWLSITDAARVCRVQDVSIRRAITSGRLPVRRQPAGDNKRTRFVRASDLPRANFPIIDSGAAITSDIRKVDILDIPLQIKRLTQLLTQIQATQTLELNQIREELKAMQQATQEQIKQILADLGVLRSGEEAANHRFTVLEEAQKDLALREQQEREAMRSLWLTSLAEMEQRQAGRMDRIAAQAQQIQDQMQQVEIRLQGQVQQTAERLQAQFRADLAAMHKEFGERLAAETKRVEALTRQIEQGKEQRVDFERIMTRVATGADAAASEAKATVATLVSQLEAERTTRQALAVITEERLSRLEAQQESAKTPPPSTRKPSSRRKATEQPPS